MPTALIVLAHPDKDSLTHYVAKELSSAFNVQGIPSEIADLAAEGFDPRFSKDDRSAYQQLTPIPDDAVIEQARIDKVDHLVLVFPVYWWSMPALLKGWVDRVFVQGWAFELTEEGSIQPSLGALTIHLLPIAGSDASTYERHGYRGALETQIEHGIIDFCGARRGSMTYIHDSETKSRPLVTTEVSSLVRDIALGASKDQQLSAAAPDGCSAHERVATTGQPS